MSFYLPICCPFFISLLRAPVLCPAHCCPALSSWLGSINNTHVFCFFWSGDNFLPFIRNAVGQTANRLGLCGLLGVFPFLCLLIPLTFYCALPSFFLSSDIQFSSFHFPLVHFQVWKKLPFSTLFDSITYILCWLVPAHHWSTTMFI